MKTRTKILIVSGIAVSLLAGAGYAYNRHGGGHHGKGHFKLFATEMFHSVDADGDGKLTQAEIDQVRNDRHAKYDANGDGNLGLEEFAGLWQETTRPLTVRVFQLLDRDGDAIVSRAEYDRPLGSIVEMLDRNDDGALSMSDRWHRRHHEYEDD